MAERPTDDFFATLPPMTRFIEVTDPSRYVELPRDWQLMVTDVRGSTGAIEQGRYKEVNMLGAASVAAALNASRVELPYVFGGDGVTLLVPDSERAKVAAALRGLAEQAVALFGLELRVGSVPVEALAADGHAVRLGRFEAAPDVSLTMLWGDGIAEAEARVKSPATAARYALAEAPAAPDLTGLECRWKPVPSRNGRIVSLLVVALSPAPEAQAALYAELVTHLDALAGDAGLAPVSVERLELARSRGAMEPETRLFTRATGGARHLLYGLRGVLRDGFVQAIRRAGLWRGIVDYTRSIPARTDFRKFDGVLRMVIDLSEAQLEALRDYLEAQRSAGRLAFGTHSSSHALITCLIRDLRTRHVHFVDGSDGGYALAARELKRQLRSREQPPAGSVGP